ncbi:MAG: hypothetical protein MUC88_20455 [Planctomycetes bacterium]|jgi:predicted  nucleic acid-binding Zn-ribbon protein|nr:hypothetical protein [Planctomycetota bacterium]
MTDQEQQGKVCPNCGPGTKTHASEKGTVCEQCGGTFTYVAGEAKLHQIGELDQLRADVEEIKQRLPASSPAADIVPGHPPGTVTHDHDDADEEENDYDEDF